MTSLSTWILSGAGVVTGVIALVITASRYLRETRAERPVEWLVDTKQETSAGSTQKQWATYLSCSGADALGLTVVLRQPPFINEVFTYPVLKVGQSIRYQLVPTNPGDAWARLSYSHPRDRSRPIMIWLPFMADGAAEDEWRRQQVENRMIRWFRAHVILSPVEPGGVTSRRGGWRDRRAWREELKSRHVKKWNGALPSVDQ